MTQRGVIPIGLILYAIAAVAVVGALWWVVDTWQDGRAAVVQLELAGKECGGAGPKGVVPCIKSIKDDLAKCEAREKALRALIAKQNAAVIALEKSAKQAQDRAKAASLAADKAATATLVERERLGALVLAGNAAGECPAGQAVAEVRKGLRP
jgi:hypothetical protein